MFMDKQMLEKCGEDVQRTYESIATNLKASAEVCKMVRKTITKQIIASYRKNYAQALENTEKQEMAFSL